MEEFSRIQRLPPYVFAVVGDLKMKLRRQNIDIVDFSMGNPDIPTPPHIVDKLVEAEYEIAHLKVKQKKCQQAIPDLQRILSYYDTDTTGTLPAAFKKLAELDMAKVPEKELIEAGLMEKPVQE